jgi:thiol:disulfide interchange protein DsbD
MDKKTILTILAVIILPVLAFWGVSFSKESSAIAQSGNKPQVIKFSSTMCLECKQVEKIFKEILPKYQDKIEYTSVIVDSRKDMNHNLIKKHKVQLVPTVVMMNSDGEECKRFEGAVSKEKYEQAIKGLK